MLFYEIEEKLKTMQLSQLRLRVAIYVRVSTEAESQATSIVNQNDFYTEMVKSNPNWTLVEVYADEGITGMSVKKRENFNRMISDAKAGKFDLVITKMVSRFARNTLDAIKFARELKSYNVGVWFHQDGVLTFEKDSEFKLTLMAAMAQNESEKKSVAVKFGLQQAIKRGTVFGFDNMWGMRKKNGRLYIDEKEIKMVTTTFELYSTDQYSLKQIEDILWEMGFRNRKGGKINHVTLSKIIQNPKYKGVFVGHKVLQTDIFEKKFIMLPESEWVVIKDSEIVPRAVSDELWERCNEILARRSKDVKNRQNLCNRPNLMTGKIRCVHCGRSYHRKDSGRNRKNVQSTWVCAGKIQNGAASCPSKYLYENELKHILFTILKETSRDFEHYMRQYEKLFLQLNTNEEATARCEEIKRELERLKKRKTKLLAYNADGEISDKEFLDMKKEIDNEMVELEKELMKLEDAALLTGSFEEKLKEVRKAIDSLTSIEKEEEIDDVFVRNYIDVIDVEVIDGIPHLAIKLITGKVINETITGLRPGNRSNLIVPGRRFLFSRTDLIGRDIHKAELYAEVHVI